MRPLWLEFRWDSKTYDCEQEFLLGNALLVLPVTGANQLTTTGYLPSGAVWYEVQSYGKQLQGGQTLTFESPLHKIPV